WSSSSRPSIRPSHRWTGRRFRPLVSEPSWPPRWGKTRSSSQLPRSTGPPVAPAASSIVKWIALHLLTPRGALARFSLELLSSSAAASLVGQQPSEPMEDAPAPPPPRKPIFERLFESGARVVRPLLPARYADVDDRKAVALGALGMGGGLVALAMVWVTLSLLRRLPARARAASSERRQKRLRRARGKRARLEALREAVQSSSDDDLSLYEFWIAAGASPDVVTALDAAAQAASASRRKFPGWDVALRAPGGAGFEQLFKLRQHTMFELLRARGLARPSRVWAVGVFPASWSRATIHSRSMSGSCGRMVWAPRSMLSSASPGVGCAWRPSVHASDLATPTRCRSFGAKPARHVRAP